MILLQIDMINYKEYIKENDISYLLDLSSNGIKFFKYFNKRPLSTVLDHKYNVMYYFNEEPVGYGHLDHDSDKLWLGILVSDHHTGKGYGKLIMTNLIKAYKNMSYDCLYLTVDKTNVGAQKLYESFNFEVNDIYDDYYEYVLRKE